MTPMHGSSLGDHNARLWRCNVLCAVVVDVHGALKDLEMFGVVLVPVEWDVEDWSGF